MSNPNKSTETWPECQQPTRDVLRIYTFGLEGLPVQVSRNGTLSRRLTYKHDESGCHVHTSMRMTACSAMMAMTSSRFVEKLTR